jgi:hypothetical protein
VQTPMTDREAAAQPQQGSTRPVYSPNLHATMAALLSTLANIDFEHEREMDALAGSAVKGVVREHIAERLRSRHRERREPYVERLLDLQAQAMAMTVGRDGRTLA